MNHFHNPLFLYNVFKSYLVEPNRLRRMKNDDLLLFQDKSLKSIVKYAYNIPLYKEKFEKKGIHPIDIQKISDIKKLPFVSKEDFRKNFPNKVVPPSFNKKSAILSATSGTTGRSLLFYFDMYTVIRSMLCFIRVLNEHNINWKKTKISLLVDRSENSFENEYFINSIFSSARYLISFKNFQIIDITDSPDKIVQKINQFKPEVILGYPFSILQLAYNKSKGLGVNIKPKIIGTSGGYIDCYSRKYIEEVFNVKTFDMYVATESGLLAFECKNKNYHICSDHIYLEYIKNQNDVSHGEPGSVVVTKLFGYGTPLIRYTGIDDVVTPSDELCSCGLAGSLIKKIHGRKSNSLPLPDGKMAFISLFENTIGESIYKFKKLRIKRIQIFQPKINKIELKVLFDNNLNSKEKQKKELFLKIKNKLNHKIGANVDIKIREVDKFNSKDHYILSKVNRDRFIEKTYIV